MCCVACFYLASAPGFGAVAVDDDNDVADAAGVVCRVSTIYIIFIDYYLHEITCAFEIRLSRCAGKFILRSVQEKFSKHHTQ